mgnify:CR=1 FL=1
MNVIWLAEPVESDRVEVGTPDSPWGEVLTVWHDDALSRLAFVDDRESRDQELSRVARLWGTKPAMMDPSDERLLELQALLAEWPEMDGKRVPTLEMIGSGFQQSVWRLLLKLQPGETVTYGRLAERLGKAGSARAVGRAVANNPVSVLVPCHRVLPSGGGTGRYAGGAARKKALLETEGALG